jgi:hypothetical protein
VHLTIGMPAVTRSDLARELIADLLRSPGLRSSLPIGIDVSNAEDLRPHLEAVASELAGLLERRSVDAPRIATTLGARSTAKTRPEAVRPLATVDAIAALAPDRLVRWRDGLDATVSLDGDRAVLHLPGRAMRFPASCAGALRSLVAGSTTPAGALAELDEADSLTISRRLLREAVIVLATRP